MEDHRPKRGSLHKRAQGLVRSGLWGLTDQGLISASNFVTLVLLARAVSPSQFGAFSLIYTGLLAANMVQFALITQPHNILGSTLQGREYVAYTSSAAVTQVFFAALLACITLIGYEVAQLASPTYAPLFLAAAPAVMAWQVQEFLRRLLYTEERYPAVLANDAISYGGQVACVIALFLAGRLSGVSTLFVVAATSLTAALVGLRQMRASLSTDFSSRAVGRAWALGKWLLAVPAYWFSTQLYLYVAAAVVSLAAAGALKAAQVLMGPLHLVFGLFESIMPVRFARVYALEGDVGLGRVLWRSFVLTVPVVGGYCLGAFLFAGPLLGLFYGQRYTAYSLPLRVFALYYFVLYLGTIISAGLRAKRLTRPVFTGYIAASLVSVGLLSIFPVVRSVGALAGIVLGSTALSLILLRAYLHNRQIHDHPALGATP